MRHTSRLMVEGKRTEVILFQTTDQNDDAPEVAVKLSNFVVGKVGPPNLRKGIGKKKGMALARKLYIYIYIYIHIHLYMFDPT